MKKLLIERFQKLAGIKPLYAIKEQEDPETMANADQEEAKRILNSAKEGMEAVLSIANDFYRAWTNEGKRPDEVDQQEGSRITNDPSWEEVSNTLSGEELFLYFVYWASRQSNLMLPFGNDGDVNKFLDSYIEHLSNLDVDYRALGGVKGEILAAFGEDGGGQEDRERLLKFLLVDTGIGDMKELPLNSEELFSYMKGGTLQSSSWTGAGQMDYDRDSGEYKFGREPAYDPSQLEEVKKHIKQLLNNV